ncbi:MAG: HPF/RaiA family ribosome-associated protein [Methylobacter sp.]|uniref:HPF/RaiA family ribosome-associated protein n=1 Tax=Methylobacter sp. TaxID=2051955 RepID=UPI00271963E9|nr:HPF/RaiA family ribosome-associated protein [Methylobacter sp.]MDO9268655.1 HPF/RaiA family ribosome-associated protein [Methylobacter sp.]MDP1665032.1 HPF/RaiA family ribosome-associated protein [Methylobacter sp.]MDP1971249.1 HPF/RaiA family ribosome-associated protein [Methylobacter sp.]
MQIPLQITFHGIPHSDAVEAKIREKASKLDRFHSHIIGCRVAVEAEHHRHHQGNQYHIRIDITTPRKELVISREHHDKKAYEDIYVAIRDAFNAATRQLEDYARIQQGKVKTHDLQSTGTVIRILPKKDHGFIEAEDGHEIYFHRNSVTGSGFDALQVGDEIRYIEESDDLGPQASIVYP